MSGHHAGITDFSQTHIKKKIRQYLELKHRSNILIRRFMKGYCHGLAVLAAYGQYLSVQTDLTQPCDNWDWMQSTLTCISNWKGRLDQLSPGEQNNIDRFIALIEFYQHISKYMPYGQGALERYFGDTRKRQLLLEYTFAGLLTADHFTTPITTDSGTTSLINELLKYDHRIVIISCGRHTISLFKNGNHVTLYDSNHTKGLQYYEMSNPGALIKAIFNAYHYNTDQPSPLGFRVLTFNDEPKAYLAPDLILQQLYTPLENDYAGNTKHYSALHIAARIGSEPCVRYFLNKDADIYAEDSDGNIPYDVAMMRNYHDLAQLLTTYSQAVNDREYQDNGQSRFFKRDSSSSPDSEESPSHSPSPALGVKADE